MSVNVRALLVKGLADHMKAKSPTDARRLAGELTAIVNAFLSGTYPSIHLAISALERIPCFPKETWNESTVGVPWEAFSSAHGLDKDKFGRTRSQALCSSPSELDACLADQALTSGLWGGSLLVALGEIFEKVEHELIVFSPYWRIDGVRALLSSSGRQSYQGVKVTVFSQPQASMKNTDKEGLTYFANTLRNTGAQVRLLSPRVIEGSRPMLHAKLIIADKFTAYVGSANFTKSGLDHGLEAGVLVEGEPANAFALWAKAIAKVCDGWEPTNDVKFINKLQTNDRQNPG